MMTVKAKATVGGRPYEVVFPVLMRDNIEGMQEWASQLFRERRGVEVRPDQIRIYEA